MAAIGLALSWAGIEAQKQEEQAWRPVGVPGFSILRLLQWSFSSVTSCCWSIFIHLHDPRLLSRDPLEAEVKWLFGMCPRGSA